MSDTTIKGQWTRAHNQANAILDRSRLCAALSKPWVLPPEGHDADMRLPEPYQSLGSRGTSMVEGKLMLALFPPGRPYFRLQPAADLRLSGQISPDEVRAIDQMLYVYELLATAKLEAAALMSDGRHRLGFRTNKRRSLTQMIVTGDTLERVLDDYRIQVYRRDQYVTHRDNAGDVDWHIVCEEIDIASLDEEKRALSGLPAERFNESDPAKRKEKIYTRCAWQPESSEWLIEQEINDKVIEVSIEPVSPFISTTYDLAPGEHYGRGLIEANLGDLRSLDSLSKRELEWAAMASKLLAVKDYNAQFRDHDLAKETGDVMRARVAGGVVQDAAFLAVNKVADFQVVRNKVEMLKQDLGRALMIESASQPEGERVTAFQVQRVAMELEGLTGGLYAPIADQQQSPLVRRVMWQLQRDRVLPPLPGDEVEISVLTGLSALSREMEGQKLLTALQFLAQMGEQGLSRIDLGVASEIVIKAVGLEGSDGLVKSLEQARAEQQQAQQAATQGAAEQKAVDVLGNIAEEVGTQALTGGQQ